MGLEIGIDEFAKIGLQAATVGSAEKSSWKPSS
jgi:hypothetical protein